MIYLLKPPPIVVVHCNYLESWLDPLGIRDLWTRVLREDEPAED